MDIFMALIMIIAGFFFLVKGADLFVDSASGIAGKLGISRSYVSRIEKKALAKISAKLGK